MNLSSLITLITLLAIQDMCLCQILGRILSYDDIFDALERQAERKERPRDGHHDHHHPHHSHEDSHHHHHHHSHKHDGPHHHHKHRHHVSKDRLPSASIRHTNEDVFSTSEQLALVRDLNDKIDRDVRHQSSASLPSLSSMSSSLASMHSKPYPLQLSASHPVLCKSSQRLATNPLFADHSHNLMDSQSSPNMMAKNFDFPFDPSKYQKDFQSMLFADQNKHLPQAKPLVWDAADFELMPDQTIHSDIFARDLAYNLNQNTFRKFHNTSPKKSRKTQTMSFDEMADPYADIFSRSEPMMEDYTRSDFDEDMFEKDMMDTNHNLVKSLPKRNSNKSPMELFDPSKLRMAKIPSHRFGLMDTISSKIPPGLKSKFNYDHQYWNFEPDIVDRNDKKGEQKEKKEQTKFGNTKTSTDVLKKHPDKSYAKLGLGDPYPKETEKSSFNSAGYLDILPSSTK